MTDAIHQLIAERGITEVLHFTTGDGLLGIVNSDAVLSRSRLETSQYLEFIYKPNCTYRGKDADWHDYVNLSISRVNAHLLGISRGSWHNDGQTWWAVLAFDAMILADPDVYFTTTNNIYTGVERGPGVHGLRGLFAEEVVNWTGNTITRAPRAPGCWTTDPQAEVLYPQQVSLDKLTSIYVYETEKIGVVRSYYGALHRRPPVEVSCRPEIFQ